MAKYCTKCGKKLEENEVCDCIKKKKKKEEEVETREKTTQENVWIDKYLDITRGIFEKPADTIKKYAKKENVVLSWIILGINSFLTVLFLYLLVKETIPVPTFPFEPNDLISSGYSMEIGSLLKIFITLMLGYVGMAGALYFIGKVLWKKEVDFNQIVSVMAIPSASTIIATLVATILIYLSIKLMGIVLLISIIFYLSNVYHGFVYTTQIEENKVAYSYTGALVFTLFLLTVIIPKLLS